LRTFRPDVMIYERFVPETGRQALKMIRKPCSREAAKKVREPEYPRLFH